MLLQYADFFYKITEILRALSLVDKGVWGRLCKLGCDILDTCIVWENVTWKQVEHFCICMPSSKHLDG